jgi:hypothetical protein
MAYAYSDIQGLLDDEDQGTGNIFGQQAQGVQVSPQEDMQQGQLKTTSEGDIGMSAAGSPSGGKDYVTAGKEDAPTVSRRTIEANVGKTETPGAISNIQGQIRSSQDELQQRADQYVTDYKKQYEYDIGKDQLKEAISYGPGSEGYQKTQDLFGQQLPEQAKEFDTSGLRLSDTQYLNNEAGLRKLASQGQGPRYSEGMSAFDVMLMQRDPNFNRMVNEIKAENVALNKALQDRPEELESQAYEYGVGALGEAQQGARDYLAGARGDLEAQNRQEAEAYNQMLANLDRGALSRQALSGVEQTLRDRFASDERIAPQLESVYGSFDASPYMQFDQGGYGYQDFLDAQEAQQFNNIAALLGDSRAYTASGPLRDQYTLDRSGLLDDMSSAILAERARADQGIQSQIDAILGGANQRAAERQADIQSMYENYNRDVENLVNRLAREKGYGLYDPSMLDDLYSKGVGWGTGEALHDQYMSGPLTGLDLLSQREADELNRLQEEMGSVSAPYQAGAGDVGGGFVDEARIGAWLQGMVDAQSRANTYVADYGYNNSGDGNVLSAFSDNPISGFAGDSFSSMQDAADRSGLSGGLDYYGRKLSGTPNLPEDESDFVRRIVGY